MMFGECLLGGTANMIRDGLKYDSKLKLNHACIGTVRPRIATAAQTPLRSACIDSAFSTVGTRCNAPLVFSCIKVRGGLLGTPAAEHQ